MDYECFLCSEFDQWAHHDIGKLNVQFFAEATLVWGDGIANLCWMASAGGRVLVVEHDGSVYSCDHFIRPEHQVGDLGNFDLGELVNTPIHRTSAQIGGTGFRISVAIAAGSRSVMVAVRRTDSRWRAGANYLCDGLRCFFAHAERPFRYFVEHGRGGIRPATIMPELLVRWCGIGENDPCPCGSGIKEN